MAFDKNNTTRGMKVIIIIFCVILVLTLMLPGMSALFGGGGQQPVQQDTAEQTQPKTLAEVDAIYSPAVETVEKQIAEDPDNPTLKSALGAANLEWGFGIMRLSQQLSLEDPSQAEPLATEAEKHFNDAVAAYDAYLETEQSDEARTSRAIALFYSNDVDGAIAALEQQTQDSPSFSPAWANLGQFVEAKGDYAAARTHYEKAVEVDPDDQYHVKGYVDTRLAMLDAIEQALESATSAPDAEVTPEAPNATGTAQ